MILVIGGRSKIGSALIEELIGRGEQVRALVGESERTDSFAGAVETMVGDLGDPGSLNRAMQGIARRSCCADQRRTRSR